MPVLAVGVTPGFERPSRQMYSGTVQVLIDRTWDGAPVTSDEVVRIELSRSRTGLRFDVDAPYHGDPAPLHPAGAMPGLWEFEVVEVFLLGAHERYLEIELGPHGHHLVIELHGIRRPVRTALPLESEARIRGARWFATAHVPEQLLPRGMSAFNAYAIHGVGDSRRFLAAHPPAGPKPDFHRLQAFAPLPAELVSSP